MVPNWADDCRKRAPLLLKTCSAHLRLFAKVVDSSNCPSKFLLAQIFPVPIFAWNDISKRLSSPVQVGQGKPC